MPASRNATRIQLTTPRPSGSGASCGRHQRSCHSGDFGVDLRPSRQGDLQFFKDDNTRPFCDHEAIASTSKAGWPFAECHCGSKAPSCSAKASDGQRGDGRFTPASDHGIGIAALNDLERIPNSVRPCGTGSGDTGNSDRGRQSAWRSGPPPSW